MTPSPIWDSNHPVGHPSSYGGWDGLGTGTLSDIIRAHGRKVIPEGNHSFYDLIGDPSRGRGPN